MHFLFWRNTSYPEWITLSVTMFDAQTHYQMKDVNSKSLKFGKNDTSNF